MDLKIFVVVPHDLYFAAEVELQCHNLRKHQHSHQLTYLVYQQGETTAMDYWNRLVERYSEVEFHFYRNDNLKNLTTIYQPVCRPYCLREHWKAHPDLEHSTILYMDSDVLFTRHMDFSVYMMDDICYLSRTDYISAQYFADKRKDVPHFRVEEYDKRDILQELCDVVKVDKQLVIDNQDNTGGCQYILKGITAGFWESLLEDCIALRLHTQRVNVEFFPSEDAGFQSWAIADMNGLLWNLWKYGKQTKTPKELDFSWAPTPIAEYHDHLFYHNAGVTSKVMAIGGKKYKMFHKSDMRFRTGTCTFFDLVYEDISPEFCSYMYVQEILEVQDPICKVINNYY